MLKFVGYIEFDFVKLKNIIVLVMEFNGEVNLKCPYCLTMEIIEFWKIYDGCWLTCILPANVEGS